MDEHVNRMYLKEEEFLETHYETVDAVLPWLGHDWRPNYHCNDHVRDRRARLLASGQLAELAFDSAALFHNRDGLTSVRLYLRSSARFLVTRIHWADGETRVEMLADNERRGAEGSPGGAETKGELWRGLPKSPRWKVAPPAPRFHRAAHRFPRLETVSAAIQPHWTIRTPIWTVFKPWAARRRRAVRRA